VSFSLKYHASILTNHWQMESRYLSRYAISGVLNTVVGFAVIFLLLWLGVTATLANTGGYLVGLSLGFCTAKKFVFRSKGHLTTEGMRYLLAFAISFTINQLVLQVMLNFFHWSAGIAQLPATATFTILMYLLTRWFVFNAKH